MFFFLDIDGPQFSTLENEQQLLCAIKIFIVNVFKYKLQIEICADRDIFILKSDAFLKISYHVIVRCLKIELMFPNNIAIKHLLLSIISNLKADYLKKKASTELLMDYNTTKHLFYNENNDIKCYIDLLVYSNNRLFRTIWSSKRGRTDVFKAYNCPDYTMHWSPFDWLSQTLITYKRSQLQLKLINQNLNNGTTINFLSTFTHKPVESTTVQLDSNIIKAIEFQTAPNSVVKVLPGKEPNHYLLQCSSTFCPVLNKYHRRNRFYILLNTDKMEYTINCRDCDNKNRVTHYLVLSSDFDDEM